MSPSPPAEQMNRMYRYTRHIYDASRKYYLLGRDRLIRRMAAQEEGAVLEVGCGTGRNLIALHRGAPHLLLYGVDAADVMLEKAHQSIAQAGCGEQIQLTQGLAQELDARSAFGRTAPFDAVFFSYALSMIPGWQGALEAATAHLKPGGRLYIVDFWDQADLPRWFATLLRRWLALFGVHYRPALHAYLRERAEREGAAFTVEPVARRYAYIAVFERAGVPENEQLVPVSVNDSITE